MLDIYLKYIFEKIFLKSSVIYLKRYLRYILKFILKVPFLYSTLNVQILTQRKKLMKIFIFTLCGTWKRFYKGHFMPFLFFFEIPQIIVKVKSYYNFFLRNFVKHSGCSKLKILFKFVWNILYDRGKLVRSFHDYINI